MSRSILYLLSLFLLLVSCGKKHDPSDTYKVIGVQDISVANYALAPTQLPLQIAFVSGTKEPVTLTLTGMPANVSDSIAPASGISTFNTIIYFTARDATAGTYPIILTATTPSGRNTIYHTNLTVTGAIATTKWYLGGQFYTAPAKIVANAGSGPAVAAVDSPGDMLEVLLPAIPATAKSFKVIDFMTYYNNYFSSTVDTTTCAVIARNSAAAYYSANNGEYITVTPIGNGNVKVAIPVLNVKVVNGTTSVTLQGTMQTQ